MLSPKRKKKRLSWPSNTILLLMILMNTGLFFSFLLRLIFLYRAWQNLTVSGFDGWQQLPKTYNERVIREFAKPKVLFKFSWPIKHPVQNNVFSLLPSLPLCLLFSFPHPNNTCSPVKEALPIESLLNC